MQQKYLKRNFIIVLKIGAEIILLIEQHLNTLFFSDEKNPSSITTIHKTLITFLINFDYYLLQIKTALHASIRLRRVSTIHEVQRCMTRAFGRNTSQTMSCKRS